MLRVLLATILFWATTAYGISVEVLNTKLNHPWSMVFLPNGDMLIAERPGQIQRLSPEGNAIATLRDLPDIDVGGQGGLFDLALHPQFSENQLIYLSWAGAANRSTNQRGNATHLGRARLDGNTLTSLETLFIATPYVESRKHFGGRIAFSPDGYLYLTVGERGQRQRAQNPNDHNGSVIRLLPDGKIPTDNPFAANKTGLPAIFSIGHRNPQGAAIHPVTGKLWIHEHGPRGGDEINIPIKGANFGWPRATFGREYAGPKIGPPHIDGLIDSIYHWTPSIAPSGMAFYTHTRFPQWKNALFVGALGQQHLVKLTLDGEKVVREEKLLQDQGLRIRDVRQGPDGYLYLLTDARNGKLLRIAP